MVHRKCVYLSVSSLKSLEVKTVRSLFSPLKKKSLILHEQCYFDRACAIHFQSVACLKQYYASFTEEQDDRQRLEDVHSTLAKVDPNTMDSTMVDVEDMTSLTEVSQKSITDNPGQVNDIKPTNSKTNASPALTTATVNTLGMFKTPGEKDESEEIPNPLEDDIFIYYD